MGASLAAILTRMVRTAMLEELGQDYIRTARAKGLSELAVVCNRFLSIPIFDIPTKHHVSPPRANFLHLLFQGNP